MNKCYTYQGVTLTLEQLFKTIRKKLLEDPALQELKYALFNVLDDTIKLIEEVGKGFNRQNSIGVSEFIDLEHDLGGERKEHLSPAYDRQSRIINSIRKLLNANPGMTLEDAIKEIEDQLKEEEGISDFGTIIHELVSVAINARIANGLSGVNSIEFAEALNKVKDLILSDDGEIRNGIERASLMQIIAGKIPGQLPIDSIILKIRDTVADVEHSIFVNVEPGSKVYSEYKIATDLLLGNITDKAGNPVKNLRGIIDCLIVKPNGTIDIIDFKVSTRLFNDWYAAKDYHTDYLLGTYRAILTSAGIDGRNVNLKVLPIYFPLGKIDNMYVEEIKNKTATSTRSTSKHLDWNDGSFTKNLKSLIRVKMNPLKYENITLEDDLKEDIEKMFGKFEIPGKTTDNLTKEELEKTIWAIQRNGKTEYGIYDRVTGKPEYRRNKEDITKDGGVIDQMLKRLKELHSKQVSTLVEQIKRYQSKDSDKIKDFDLLDASKDNNIDVYNILNETFGKYCNSLWLLVEIPELIDRGIFIFQSNTGTFDVVRFTDKNLRTELNISGGSTVLGKYVTNDAAKGMTTVKPLNSSVANVLLLETLLACNKVAEILRSGKLGKLEIVNALLGLREPAETRLLLANFNFLTSKAGIENNFRSGKIQIAEMWELMQDTMNSILLNPMADKELKMLVSNLEVEPTTNLEKLKLLIKLMNKLEDYSSLLRHSDLKTKRTFNTPEEKIYLVLSNALLYYRETPVLYDGRLSKWGLHFEEIIRLLGTPVLSQYKSTLNNGYKAIGLGQGLDMGTPTSSASTNLSALFLFWESSFLLIREFTLDQSDYINNITVKYFKRHGVSNISRAILNSSSVWENFIEKGPDGKYTKELRVVKPESLDNKEDLIFLNQLLWEINKFLLNNISDELKKWRYEEHAKEIEELPLVINTKNSNKYYQLPLRRATNFDRIRHIRDNGGVITALKKYWDTFGDMYDPRQLHSSAQRIVTSEFGEVTEMYNLYRISDRARAKLLEEEGVYDFETDLNLLALDVAFLNKRKLLFDDCLTHANAMAVVFHYLNDTSDANFDEELENLEDEVKIILKNETIIPKELREVSKGISMAKQLNSILVLSVRPLLFLKELAFGQFTNYSRAWALSGTDLKISAKNIFKANRYVWGNMIAGWLESVTTDLDLASFTLVLKINKLYGLANEDLNQIVRNNSLSRTGLKHGNSKWMYVFNSAPDFFNRMTLFVAKMIEDGCFDAHYLDSNGQLQYDIKKDKRFSKLVSLGMNSNSKDAEYLKQKALYKAIINEFIKEGYTKPDGSLLDPTSESLYLPKAYTAKEKMSIKEISDNAYGYYDHEARSLNDHKFFGLVFKLFMAFWTAKTTLWLRAPGANTALGHWEELKENGQIVYERIYEDENGIIHKELTTENPNGDLEPVMVWKGDYVEGLMYSIGYSLRDIFTLNWLDLVENKTRLGNLKLALHDILIGIILYNILRLIFSGGSGKTSDMNPIERTLVRAMLDTSPAAIFGLSLTPSFVSTLTNLKNDIPSLFTEDKDTADFIRKRFGAIRDITWEQH